ncbi:MAG: ABC transporter ATP-binding protein [Polyangia bacterium]
MPEALRCTKVTLRHEPDAAPTLSDVSFSMEEGERVALVGLNGAGKTTLLMSLVGLVPHEGEIEICGKPLERRSIVEIRRKIGFLFNVPEDQLLFPRAIEDVAFGPLQAGRSREESFDLAEKALESLGVGKLGDTPLHHLSHGQKQRVALAGALVTEPSLLLLDEPTAGLDPPGKLELAELLCVQTSAQLIATHDLDFADSVCSRIILIEGGTVAESSVSTTEIRSHWKMM